MGKVRFEFDDVEEQYDVNFITNRCKVMNAIRELDNLRRTLYKGYYTESDYAHLIEDDVEITDWCGNKCKIRKAVKLVTPEDLEKAHEDGKPYVEGTQTYIKSEWIEDKIQEILSEISFLLD